MQIQKIKLAQLAPNTGQIPGLPSNPRQWTKSDVERIAKSLAETPELFEARPIIATPYNGQLVILGGNLRYEGARKNKDTEVPVVVIPEDTPVEKMKEIVIKDNGAFGAWDFDQLANEWDNGRLLDWGVPAWEVPNDEDLQNLPEEDNNYSRKIEAPIYEPTGEKVSLIDCVNTKKYKELITKIDSAGLPKEVSEFLRMAATRHIVFDYAKIADYYSNAGSEIQELMEDSALVIIDFDKAIENGFVKMTEELSKEYISQIRDANE